MNRVWQLVFLFIVCGFGCKQRDGLEYLEDYTIRYTTLSTEVELADSALYHIAHATEIPGPVGENYQSIMLEDTETADSVEVWVEPTLNTFHIGDKRYQASRAIFVAQPPTDTIVIEEQPLLRIKQNDILKDIRSKYSDQYITSGRANKPALLGNCLIDSTKLFGFYAIADSLSKLPTPVVATAIVQFDNYPWLSDDKSQIVIAVIVKDSLFKVNLTGFRVGDKTPVESHTLVKANTIDDITYYRQSNTNSVAVKSKDGIITKYLFWTCPFMMEDIEQIHPVVSNYLN